MVTLINLSKKRLKTLLFLVGVLCIVSNPHALAHTDVTPEQARDLIDSTDNLVVVDVREEYEYCDERGHIPGALNYPLSSGVLEARYEELPIDGPILVVCRSGGRSNAAANFLDSNGFLMVYDMMGGMMAWVWETEPCKQDDDNETGSTETSTYVFLSDQSTVVKTGGLAGVHETYPIQGQFQLKVDVNDAVASFGNVEAFLLNPLSSSTPQSLGEMLNMIELKGTVVNDVLIEFSGKTADDTNTDIALKLTFIDDSVQLTGQTIPPPGSADFFIFNVDAFAQKKYSGGTGEPSDPYQIATAEDLMLLGESPDDYDKHFILTADIDLDPNLPGRKVFDKALIAPEADAAEWNFQGATFSGSFDGNDHKISNLTVTGEDYLGLFGLIDSQAKISGLSIMDVNVISAGEYDRYTQNIGGLVGANYGNVVNCNIIGNIIGDWDVGGLVGYNHGSVIQCYSSGTIMGDDFVGGLLGDNSGTVINCYSTCSVTGTSVVGGLVGENWGYNLDGNITGCYSTGVVTGSSHVGGLVGINTGNMINCSSTGAAIGNKAIGGLVGMNGVQGVMPYPGYIDNSYSLASVRGEIFVGGLVGDNRVGDVMQCYSKGIVTGNEYVGGLIGQSYFGSIVNSYSTGEVSGGGNCAGGLVGGEWLSDTIASFWDTQTSGQATSTGGTGKTTIEMQTASTFLDVGWDFVDETVNGIDDIWWIIEGQDYPRLFWELIPDN